jgi:hypothetical protein
MKCIMNKDTKQVTRVSDDEGARKCGGSIQSPTAEWQYVPKRDWKATK